MIRSPEKWRRPGPPDRCGTNLLDSSGGSAFVRIVSTIVFDRIIVWRDELPRSGPANMAVDELLLEGSGGVPVLRVYEWQGDWISLGYFSGWKTRPGEDGAGEVRFVRRATGGGIVDHRQDVTYTIVAPRQVPMVGTLRSESYRLIHEALAESLQEAGVPARIMNTAEGRSARCFEAGAQWDVAGEDGGKIAGAAQRRMKAGLLHQGSVLLDPAVAGPTRIRKALADGFPRRLAREVVSARPPLDPAQIEELARQKYANEAWLARRP